MPATKHRSTKDTPDSTALVVLGMHRSGTSALTRLLHTAGADAGGRLLGASAGNELGHWEDAFVVETNERLLAALGRRWDDVRPLPAGWLQDESAVAARRDIIDYIRGTRLQHCVWAMKDPRMCLLAPLWFSALGATGVNVLPLLLARHPQEVAASLAARDGMAPARAHLLWARHMLAAEHATRGCVRRVFTYDQLVAAPAKVLERIRSLPGADTLAAAGETKGAIQAAARHHQADGDSLPAPMGALWSTFSASGELDTAALDAIAADLASADRLYVPLLTDIGREQQLLWERIARAEAGLAGGAEAIAEAGLARELAPSLDQLRDGIDDLSQRMGEAITVELRRMQDEHAKAVGEASALAARVGMADELVPSLDQVRDGVGDLSQRMGDAITVELRRMQDEHAKAVGEASALAARVGMADALVPSLDQLRDVLDDVGTRLSAAIGNEIARMQAEHAKALAASSELSAQAALARDIHPELRQLRETLAAMLERAHEDNRLQRELGEQRQVELQVLGAELARERGATGQLQQELAQLRHQVPVLQADADLLRQIRGSRSWRLTKPLRFAARVMRGGVTRADRERIERWWALLLASTPLLPQAYRERKWRQGRGVERIAADVQEAIETPSPTPVRAAPPIPGKPDVFMWAVIDWHFRTQRPQHLARGLVEAGHRVFYLSNNLVDDPAPGCNIEALDDGGRLFQVFLNAEGAPAIYYGTPCEATVMQLRRSIGELMEWAGSDGGLCIVQHPFWSDVASRVPGAALLYDCMDHHAGFEDNAPDVLRAEAGLTRAADLLVVTSDWLDRELASANPNRALIRNAGDFEHFRHAPAEVFQDRQGRRVLGYYGAIAEWFDVGLVRKVAREYPDCLVLLVGNDTAGVGRELADEPNVMLTGEVPYDSLPYYLHGFDVAVLPFKVIPLTLATNPVKVYEYLGAGKPVVAVDLPEMQQFGDLLYVGADHDGFLARIGEALEEEGNALVERRMAFASEQTWVHRAEELDAAIAALPEPLVSVVVLTYNNLDFTRACLQSLERESNWRNLELIVVDNASTDGTRDFLRQWEGEGPGRRIILNDSNLGFSAGNNVGLAAAAGDYLVVLNNDTYVTPNWVRTMVNHLARDPGIGILGPVTNNIGNEARIEINYADMDEMKRAAAAHTRRHIGALFDITTVAFFCVAMPRSTWEQIGPLDEAFGIGFFEDDDYCRRVEAAGLRIACAEDVFVHHHLSASFDALKAERKQELFERNKAIYEAKWGPWTPHAYRAPD